MSASEKIARIYAREKATKSLLQRGKGLRERSKRGVAALINRSDRNQELNMAAITPRSSLDQSPLS